MSSKSHRHGGYNPHGPPDSDHGGTYNSSPRRSRPRSPRSQVMDDYIRRPRQTPSPTRTRGRSREFRNDFVDRRYAQSPREYSTSPGPEKRSSRLPKLDEESSRRSRPRSLDTDRDYDRARHSTRNRSPGNRARSSTTRPKSRSSSPHTSVKGGSVGRASTMPQARTQSRSFSPRAEPGRRSSRYYPPSSSKATGHRERASSSQPRKSSRSPSRMGDPKIWMGAARCAMQAGAMAAMRVHGDPGPWIGSKGASVATAALGAAVVDTFVEHRTPAAKGGMRHAVAKGVTLSALGSLVPKGRRS